MPQDAKINLWEHNFIIYLLETALNSNTWKWDFKVSNGSDLDSVSSLFLQPNSQPV